MRCLPVERAYARLARAALRAFPGERRGRVGVLMYHNVCRLPVADAPFYQHVLPDQFAEQIAWLKREGYRAVALERLVARLETGRELPPRAVAITFDDGYRDLLGVWHHLERAGFVATIFLATGYVGRRVFPWLVAGAGPHPEGIAPLTWDEVRELAGRGASLGSHGVSHLPLETLSEAELRLELALSRREIEEQTGRAVHLFSVPFACPEDERLRRRLALALRQAGYRAAVTTALGTLRPGADLAALPRLPINAQDTLATFEAKVAGAYDWLRPLQRGYKLWLKPRRRPGAGPAMPRPS